MMRGKEGRVCTLCVKTKKGAGGLKAFHPNRQPEKVFVPENGQSWQRIGCLLFQALSSCAHDFQYSTEKRCTQLGPFVSFNEINVLYIPRYYFRVQNKRACTPYLILTKLPPCTLLLGSVCLFIFVDI